MAKGARSNSKKKLGSQRREAVLAKTSWLAAADAKRQDALQKCLGAEPIEMERISQPEEAAGADAAMSDDGKAAGSGAGSKYVTKKKKLALKRKGGKVRKVSVLSGRNQFHKKKKKGV